jgi:predicted NBD/HSP70 family sugar kinase
MNRAELMQAARMTQPTLHRALSDLRSINLVEIEGGVGGREVVHLGRAAGMAVAVDVGRAHRRAVLANAHGSMLTDPVDVDMSDEPDDCGPKLLDGIADLILEAIQMANNAGSMQHETPYALAEVHSVGVGIPFPVSPGGTTVGTFAGQLSGVPLASVLRRRLEERAGQLGLHLNPQMKIRFAKDGDLGAIALWRDRLQDHLHGTDGGVDPLQESLLYLKASYGLDAGIMCHGMLVAGGRGLAGQLGHMWLPYLEEPLRSDIYGPGHSADEPSSSGPWPQERCPRCNRIYCLENVASGRAILRDIGAGQPQSELVSVPDLVEHLNSFRTMRPDVRRIVIRAASIIGVALADAVRLADPTKIFVGGLLAQAGETVMTPLRIAFARAGLPGLEPDVLAIDKGRVTRLELEGAVALALKGLGIQRHQ